MTCSPWLPKEAFTELRLKRVLSEPIAAWSEHWLSGPTAELGEIEITEDARCDRPVTLDLPLDGKRRLLGALLDIDLSRERGHERDERLLNALTVEVVEDLGQRVDAILAHDVDDGPSGRIARASVLLGSSHILAVAVRAAALVPAIKTGIATVKAASPLRRRQIALGRMRLAAHAVIGRSELALQEVKELKAGDVIVLDRGLAEPVELYLEKYLVARGSLRRNGNAVSIQL